MKNVPSTFQEQPGHGTPEMLRDVIAEALRGAALHADHGSDHALIGDIRLLQLNVRQALAYLKVVVDTLPDLIELDAKRVPH